MPIPKRRKNEDKADFLSRCMADPIMNKDYPDNAQRYAICQTSAKADIADNVKDNYYDQVFGSTELILDENKMYIPNDSEYVDFGESTEDYIIGQSKPGLWENIRKKKEREGKKYKPAKPGDPDRPDPKSWKKAQSDNDIETDEENEPEELSEGCPLATKDISTNLANRKNCVDKANYGPANPELDNSEFWQKKADLFKTDIEEAKTMRCGNCSAFIQTEEMMNCIENGIDPEEDGYAEDVIETADLGYCELFDFKCAGARTCDAWIAGGPITDENEIEEDGVIAKFQYEDPVSKEVYLYNRMGVYRKNGRVLIYIGKAADTSAKKVKLNKPFRTPKGPKKFSVYVKNDKGNVVKVNFGDPNMDIKRDDPARRKSFRARHHCDTDPGPKWKARYWSCKFWSSENVSNLI